MNRKLFRKDYKYKRKFINACIMRIRFGHRSDETVLGYKTYVFKAMRGIVEKNIFNYINLLNGSPCRSIPEYNEILSECWLIFEKCLEKYKITRTNNFYFYFNKSLGRSFYKLYTKEINHPCIDLTNEIATVHPKLSENATEETDEMIFQSLRLNDFEKKVCRSRMKGEPASKFIKAYKDQKAAHKKYQKALQHIRFRINQARDNNNW